MEFLEAPRKTREGRANRKKRAASYSTAAPNVDLIFGSTSSLQQASFATLQARRLVDVEEDSRDATHPIKSPLFRMSLPKVLCH
jgi:hypothetical protein